MAYETIELDVSRAGVAVVLLNRPEKRNALNAVVIEELHGVIETLSKTPEVRVVILRGAGPAFCAGADIEWLRAAADYSIHDNEEDAFALAEMMRRFHELPQLTIAMVHGAAMAGGCGLVAAADVAVALKGTQFRFSEVRLGIVPANVAPYVMQAIGPRWARALFATAESFDAAFAHQIGLVQYVAEDETELDGLVEHLTSLVFRASPRAVAEVKELVDEVIGEPIDTQLSRRTSRRLAHARTSPDGREGLSAFLEKRKPAWEI
jgi:methylglutaconyl-CoA hydratase